MIINHAKVLPYQYIYIIIPHTMIRYYCIVNNIIECQKTFKVTSLCRGVFTEKFSHLNQKIYPCPGIVKFVENISGLTRKPLIKLMYCPLNVLYYIATVLHSCMIIAHDHTIIRHLCNMIIVHTSNMIRCLCFMIIAHILPRYCNSYMIIIHSMIRHLCYMIIVNIMIRCLCYMIIIHSMIRHLCYCNMIIINAMIRHLCYMIIVNNMIWHL